jgi:ribosome-associated heat shock protein Hsp15
MRNNRQLFAVYVRGYTDARLKSASYRKIDHVRMDKWLWAARFFKTRASASRACELGRTQFNGQPAKGARELRIGDILRVTNDGGDSQVEVLLLSEEMRTAALA